jgi:hypothetical protein
MEPRALADGKAPTCWDIRRSPPETLTEAKLSPTRADILEWLDRVEEAVQARGGQKFRLLYSRGPLRLLTAIDSLRRLAVEANGDADKLGSLVRIEPNDDVRTVLAHLKTEPHRTFSRIRIVRVDPISQDDRIRYQLQFLVREADRQRLRDSLYGKLARGVETRATYSVRQLIEEVRGEGVELRAPPVCEPENLDPVVGGAIAILQLCKLGLPAGVLAGALNCTPSDLESKLVGPDVGACFLRMADSWNVVPLSSRLVWPDGLRLAERALQGLLEFIRANRLSTSGRRQVANAVALAKTCEHSAPVLVASVFRRLDKMLKRTGNKRLVLDVANLSIAAARRFRNDETARDEAAAMICGRSWALQRIGQLREARAAGENSLERGRELRWDRNTAFCYKCLGRLCRLEAERAGWESDQFPQFIAESRQLLLKAIELFPHVNESNLDREGEVGDCYSLLGRTCMAARDLLGAEAAAREACSRIVDTTSKHN